MMFGRSSDEEAFHVKGTIAQVMQYQRQQMRDEINRIPETKLKSAPVDQLAEEMAEKFSINIPVLDENATRPTRREVDIDYSGDPYSRAYHTGRGGVQKGTEITISVPYQGDAEVFRIHASSHTMDYPRGKIERSEIIFRRRGTNLDAGQVRQEFDGWLAAIKQHLAQMTQELGDFNNTLVAEASGALNARMAKFQRDDQLLAGLGFGAPTRS